ncbi:MAG: TIR domain-containing protein [Deltaproteobacteria bacterium]|nr:TIR domain-containing protein [Deltaproteobacteria bacterium]
MGPKLPHRDSESPLVYVTGMPQTPDAISWCPAIEDAFKARHRLAETLEAADMVLVVIGRDFRRSGLRLLSPLQGPLEKTLDLNGYAFRALIRNAVDGKKCIVPVLVNGAHMPDAALLPSDLQFLRYLEALYVESKGEIAGLITRILTIPLACALEARDDVKEGSVEQRMVFLAYRREDSSFWADSLARALSRRLGRQRVFLDVSSQHPSEDYRSQISKALARSTDVVLLIGSGFLESRAGGERRIEKADDQLRIEIRTALQEGKRLHVVIAGGASMPSRADLPYDIAPLVETTSVFRLTSDSQVEQIVDKIFPRVGVAPSEGIVDGLKAEWNVYASHVESILAELVAYGWTEACKGSERRGIRILSNERFDNFRIELRTQPPVACLEERTASLLRAGLPRWVTRDVIPVSPYEATANKAMRLPERLLEAVLDPVQYLNRRGRFKIKKESNPFWRHDSHLANMRLFRGPCDAEAIEAFQESRRRLSARGGPKTLRRVKYLGFDLKGAQGIAFHPSGEWLAIAADTGAMLVETRNWQIGAVLNSPASWQAAGFSRDGHLALGSDRGRISIWDSNGVLIRDRVRVHRSRSLLRTISGESDRTIAHISWSPNGQSLACCSDDAACFYNLVTGNVSHWALPKLDPPEFDGAGAHFTAKGNEALIHGLRSFFCILQIPELTVLRVVQRKIRPKQELIADETEAIDSGRPFSDIYHAEPSPGGDLIACAGEKGRIALYDLSSLELLATAAWFEPYYHGMPRDVAVVSFSPDGRLLAAIADQQRMVIGDVKTLAPVYESPDIMDFVWTGALMPRVAWSPDSSLIAVNDSRGVTKIWAIR